MRIFFALIFFSIACSCFANLDQDQAKNQVNCSYREHHNRFTGVKLIACHIRKQKIEAEGFTISDEFDEDVEYLEISNNKKVKFLPENVTESFPNLMEYEVRNCSIKSVHGKHLEGLFELERLQLWFNEIETIASDSFKDLEKLKVLRLSHNQIKHIDPAWFQTMTNLTRLIMNSNRIEIVDEKMFENSPNLQQVWLFWNNLTTIPENLFKNNLELEKILLDCNQIETISLTAFDHLTKLQEVDLKHNVCINQHYKAFGDHEISEMKKDLSSTKC